MLILVAKVHLPHFRASELQASKVVGDCPIIAHFGDKSRRSLLSTFLFQSPTFNLCPSPDLAPALPFLTPETFGRVSFKRASPTSAI